MDWMNCKDNIKSINFNMETAIQNKLNNLTKPIGSLGKLEDLAKQYCLIKETVNPILKNKVIFTLAGDHGVVEEGVSAFPQEVTQQMVLNFLNNGAGINVLAKHADIQVVVADFGVIGEIKDKRLKNKKVNHGTKNMANGSAMTKDEAESALNNGIELFQEELENNNIDILGIGEMGIGNTTSASAITAVITQSSVEEVTGKGTGIEEKALENKINTIKKAIQKNNPDKEDALDVLRKVGGFEIGGMAGIILGAAANKTPVIIDGFISASAALIANQINPKVKDYLIASHCSVEQGHKIVLNHLNLSPLFDLNLRLGEGTGSALAIGLVDASVKILNEMASFDSAGVSNKNG